MEWSIWWNMDVFSLALSAIKHQHPCYHMLPLNFSAKLIYIYIYNHFSNRLHVKCAININWKWLWPIHYKLFCPCTYICHSWHCHSLLRFSHSWQVILYLKLFYMADMWLYPMPTCHIFLTIIHNAFPPELLHSDFFLSPWYIHEYWFFSTEQSD